MLLQSPGDSDIEDSDPGEEGMSPDPKEGGASSSATSTKKVWYIFFTVFFHYFNLFFQKGGLQVHTTPDLPLDEKGPLRSK